MSQRDVKRRRIKKKRLVLARRTRDLRASEFARMRDGEFHVRDVLEDPESFSIGSCKLYDLLRRAPHLGTAGAKKICINSRVWPMDRVVDISKWDRDVICQSLPPRAKK